MLKISFCKYFIQILCFQIKVYRSDYINTRVVYIVCLFVSVVKIFVNIFNNIVQLCVMFFWKNRNMFGLAIDSKRWFKEVQRIEKRLFYLYVLVKPAWTIQEYSRGKSQLHNNTTNWETCFSIMSHPNPWNFYSRIYTRILVTNV